MLGKGWFPDQLGGLDRYFRALLEHQPEARAVVIGPAAEGPDRVVAVSGHEAPLAQRLLAFAVAAHRAAADAAVVDAHFALYALAPLLVGRARALPLVVHFQGPWADENVAQGDASSVRRSLRRALERTVYRRATRVIVLSSAFRRLLVERYRVSPWRIRVEPPGVDLDRFTPGDRAGARQRAGAGDCPFLAVCVRRLVPRMGLDVLLEAWARALPGLPTGSRLFVAGDGPLRFELDEQVQGSGLADSVQLLGRIDDDALVDLYRAADVGVVPTRSFEGFGLVVIEAAACGTPTIVTSVGGLPEAVAGLDTSLAVPPGDVGALATRILQAAQPDGLPTRTATRSFAERYAWPEVAERNRLVAREAITPEVGDRRLRVVYLDHVGGLSGGEIAILRLVPHLLGVDPHFILAQDGPFADALTQAGISTEVLPMAEGSRGLSKDSVTLGALRSAIAVPSTAAYIVRLAVWLRRMRVDLVHTNSLKAGVYGSIAGRLAGVPVVWHVRDRIATDYLPGSAVRMIRAMTRRLPAAVICNSEATLTTLGPSARSSSRYTVVPEVLAVSERRGAHSSRPMTVGMVGRLAPWKGQDLLLRAFAESFPGGDARCVLVGAAMFGEDDYSEALRRLADELGLLGRVEFRGFRSDIWPELGRMDLLVHASIIPEPFGQVIIEGMAAGVPVIAAAAGGPAEIIRHDVNGVLYEPGDRAALAEAMRQLAADPERRRRLSEAALASVAAFEPRAIADRVEQLYRDAIARSEPWKG
jgi:glycosyltransferase involved in cell wall biosynthesis